jgi:chromosome segregation ATPase
MAKHADWMRALDQLKEALDHTAVDLARHEQALSSPLMTSDLSGERQVSWQRAIERFAERLQDCQAQVGQAEGKTQQAEAALAQEEEQLHAFRKRVDQVRQQLAKLPARV